MKRFFALSRTVHGVLDLAAPGFTAVLILGGFPSALTLAVSLFTAFAAYTAVYALNDLAGMAVDKEKFSGEGINAGYSVEASELRHPLAQGALSMGGGALWFAGWFIAALAGAYWLNPVIVYILLSAAVLEFVYVSLLKVTYWRTLVSGLVKSSGPLAAVFVVQPSPAPAALLLLFAWLLFWEIGGQNIPADWNDVEEDKRVGAKTIPIRFGAEGAGRIVFAALTLTVILSLFLPTLSPLQLGLPYLALSAAAGFFLLLLPGYQLLQTQDGKLAAKLFDKASYYPLAQLTLISIFALLS
ncbi:MAG: hypothetical protein Fur002_23600 [Anaerolineales bacterium]